MANIIVTGGLGWIGRHVVRNALQNGHNVGILDYLEKPEGFTVPYARADITSQEQVGDALIDLEEALGKEDLKKGIKLPRGGFYVVHTAADFDYSSPIERLFDVNVVGTTNVTKQAAKAGYFGIVNIGAAAEYGDDYEEPIKEDFDLNPTENYGMTKMQAEEVLLRANQKGDIKVASLRAPMVYGPDALGTYIAGLFNSARGPLLVAPIKLTTNSYAHVNDVAWACVHAVEDDRVFQDNPERLSDIAWNIADDDPINEREVLRLAGQLAKNKENRWVFPIVPYSILQLVAHASQFLEKGILKRARSTLAPDMVIHSRGNHILDGSKFKDTTGFEYEYPSVKVGFPEVVEWFRENVWNK
jgi:nucleoside-diphosphate-sugar epimerase